MLAPHPAFFPNSHPASATAPLCTVLVDAEEDFDWMRPMHGTPYNVASMRHLADFQGILAAYRAVPTYLLTYPVLCDAAIVAGLRGRMERGQCQVGVQLHSWVTPPFDETADVRNSFAGNLGPALEERKLIELMRQFRRCFGEDPKIFRAGRYGLGPHTPALLERHGFLVDTSLAPCTSFGDEAGPDFSGFDYQVFWFGERRRMLELPLCRAIAGWGGDTAARAYRWLAHEAPRYRMAAALPGVLAWTRSAERITLSPEGNDVTAIGRLVGSLLQRGQTVVALSLHSSSLSVGQNPYVRDRADLHHMYDRLSAILDLLSGRFGMEFVAAMDLPSQMTSQPHPADAA